MPAPFSEYWRQVWETMATIKPPPSGGDSPVDIYTIDPYTVPDPTLSSPGTIIYVSDAPVGDEWAISDGSVWRTPVGGAINGFGNIPDPPSGESILFRMDDDITYNEGSLVPILTQNGVSMEQAVTGSQPTMKEAMYGGHKILRFEDDMMLLDAASALASGSYSILVVYAYVPSAGLHRLIQSNSVADWFIGPWNGKYQAYNGATNTDGPVNTDNNRLRRQLIVVDDVADTMKNFVDGVQVGNVIASGPNPGRLRIGGSGETPSSDVTELRVWPFTFDAAQVTEVFDYATAYYPE